MTQNQNRKEMPCMTACPWDAFKHQGLFYNTEMVVQASFDKEEIFFEHETRLHAKLNLNCDKAQLKALNS